MRQESLASSPMSEEERDNDIASTQMFQAFMDRPREPEPSGARWLLVGLAAFVVAAILVALAWFLLGG